jgi:hypothetical protein
MQKMVTHLVSQMPRCNNEELMNGCECKSPICTVTEFSNLCQEGTDSLMCSGIVLKKKAHFVQRRIDGHVIFYVVHFVFKGKQAINSSQNLLFFSTPCFSFYASFSFFSSPSSSFQGCWLSLVPLFFPTSFLYASSFFPPHLLMFFLPFFPIFPLFSFLLFPPFVFLPLGLLFYPTHKIAIGSTQFCS